jgi:hypothetical protein
MVVHAGTLAGECNVPWLAPVAGKEEFWSSWRMATGSRRAAIIQNESLRRTLRTLVGAMERQGRSIASPVTVVQGEAFEDAA